MANVQNRLSPAAKRAKASQWLLSDLRSMVDLFEREPSARVVLAESRPDGEIRFSEPLTLESLEFMEERGSIRSVLYRVAENDQYAQFTTDSASFVGFFLILSGPPPARPAPKKRAAWRNWLNLKD